jgi:carboxymethylenebutenolidase
MDDALTRPFSILLETAMTLKDTLQDAQSLLGEAHTPSRRMALGIALGAAYTTASEPLAAQTIVKTPTDGLDVGEVMLDVAGHKMPVYRAAPAGKKDLPVVLVLSEIFGVHAYIADTARRFARAGYLALAPELFVRQGDPTAYNEIAKLVAEVINKVPDAQVATDLDATLDWAGKNGGDLNRVGVTGFCWGGRQTWMYAAHSKRIKAGVAWYGRLVGQANALQPKHPADVAAQLHGPVLGLYGEKDTGIPLESVDAMKRALAAANTPAAKASEFVIYPDAPHAFHADYRPSYREAAALDGWQRCLAWFKQHGV